MIWILVFIYILILALELPALLRDRWYKEIAVFAVLFTISVYLGMVQIYDWPFYNIMDTILPALDDHYKSIYMTQ
ncbi:MAG: hypothetical protein GX825_09645 [Syntrophomonadaceae bacterium]|nr:hypothetical protein [Syntrophomonadaceae bacterium]